MAAVIGLAPEVVAEACAEAAAATREVCSVANFNAPDQTVVAGSASGVAKAAEILKARGARRVLPLSVSAPFHCALMKPAEEKLAPFLAAAAFRPLAIPVVTNVDARETTSSEVARESLRRQICSPVRWVESVQRLAVLAPSGVEAGPGTVLAGLAKRIAKDWPMKITSTAAALATFAP
jgi:[acyl-carrier-protein] S-malonyltransferase